MQLVVRYVACLAALGVVVSAASADAAEEQHEVAVLNFVAKIGIEKAKAELFAELVQDEVRNRLGYQVIGQSDIETMLGLERMKDVLACEDNSACMAQIGGALGVDEIVVGSLGKLGSYLIISLKRINPIAAVVLGQATLRLKGADDDALIEAVGPMVEELYEADAQNAAAETAEAAQKRRAEEEARKVEQANLVKEMEEARKARAEAEEAKRLAQEETLEAREEKLEAEEEALRSKREADKAAERARVAEREKEAIAVAEEEEPEVEHVISLPVALGMIIGSTFDIKGLSEDPGAQGIGFSVEAFVEFPKRWLDIGIGFATPNTLITSLRFWVYRGAFEFGLVARYAMFGSITNPPVGEMVNAVGGGLVFGWGIDTFYGQLGVRAELQVVRATVDHPSPYALPVTLAAFYRL